MRIHVAPDGSLFHVGGKRPLKRRYGQVVLGDHLDRVETWPEVPAAGWEYGANVGPLEVLGNDLWGDCADAGMMHSVQTMTGNTSDPVHATTQQTLDLYSAQAGFNINAGPPGNNPTDQGTVLTDLLNYVVKNGVMMTDRRGNVVKVEVLGWAAVDITSVPQMRFAAYNFGHLYVGIQCPANFLSDTSNWIFDPTSPIEGGHCVNGEGEGHVGAHVQSWGLNIPSPWSTMLQVLDEAYIFLTDRWVDKNKGKTPSGLDMAGLESAMQKFNSSLKAA